MRGRSYQIIAVLIEIINHHYNISVSFWSII